MKKRRQFKQIYPKIKHTHKQQYVIIFYYGKLSEKLINTLAKLNFFKNFKHLINIAVHYKIV